MWIATSHSWAMLLIFVSISVMSVRKQLCLVCSRELVRQLEWSYIRSVVPVGYGRQGDGRRAVMCSAYVPHLQHSSAQKSFVIFSYSLAEGQLEPGRLWPVCDKAFGLHRRRRGDGYHAHVLP